jgi:hypothetical protein
MGVGSPDFTGVTLTPAPATVYDDTYQQFHAIAHYSDGTTSVLQWSECSFASSDKTVADFTHNIAFWGRAFAANPGTTTITVGMYGRDDEATTTLTVIPPPPPPPPPSARFSLGFGTGTLDPYPTWTPIDTHPNLVTSYSIDRGRAYELDQTDAGHATVQITDPDGILDPTNPAGPYYGQIRPLLHAVLCRQDPVTGLWEERFRGYVEEYSYDIHPSQQVNQLTVSLVDLFEIAGSAEMQPGQFGADINGQVSYGVALSNERVVAILTDLGLPRHRYATLPGTVMLHSSRYSGGESALSAVQEAADGEFPNLANVYCDRHGRICFHGRTARFDPATVAAAAGGAWDYHHWNAGDGTAITASPADTAQVRALGFTRGLSKIINIATALELGAPDSASSATSDRRVTDPASIAMYGMRSWSTSNLLTFLGDRDATYSTSAATETKRFATFYVQNYAQPKDRINSVEFRSLHPTDPRAPANWRLMSQVDISDTITLTVATAGGGFHAEEYFVEGVHEDVQPLAAGYDDVTVTLDLSPRSYYGVNPWATPLSGPDPSMPSSGTDAANPRKNPPAKSSHPKPKAHSGDHDHDGPDPTRIQYENTGTGIEDGGGDVDVIPYSISGPLTVTDGTLRWYALTAGTILQVFASAGTGGLTVRVNRNGASIGTATIPAGSNTAAFTPASPDYTAGDYFTVDVTAAGTGAADLVVELQVAQ